MRRRYGHIRQRSEDSFEIRYSTGKDPATGKWKVKTQTVNGSREDAEAELHKVLASIGKGQYLEPSKITVGAFLKDWLEAIRSQVGGKTHERYSQIVDFFLIPAFGPTLLPKLVPAAIQQKYNGWEASGRRDGKEGGLAPRTRLHIHRVLKAALGHAVQLELIGRNPANALKPPRAKKAPITTLTVQQAATLLNAIRGKSIYWPVLLALTTGMRRGEILALRWKNLDLEKKTVRVVESVEQTKKGIRLKAPKTERTRAIILPDYAAKELRAWKEKQVGKLAKRKIRQTGETFVCGGPDGKMRWPTNVTHRFIKAIKELPDLPRVRFHDLRHSHATQLLAAGVHPKIAQERLGHSTITTTLDLYSHATDTMQDEAAAKLDMAMRTALKPKRKPIKGPQLG